MVKTAATQEKVIQEATEKYDNAYIKMTPKSQAALEAAARVLPGGDSRTATFYYPYPIFLDRGEGCRVFDVDGHEYIDFNNCYTALIQGHSFAPIINAVRETVGRYATALGSPTTLITELAETMSKRVASLETMRFCNSGSEAAMFALRAARAFTGRNKILKIEGGYNGAYDTVIHPSDAQGIPRGVQADQLNVPFNDADAAERLITENKKELACVIAEGIMGAAGQITPKKGYLERLAKAAQANGVLFILDEVMTFRLDHGGIQHVQGITPDLTMFGKIIGGGFPVGGWGGRRDIMELFDPIKGKGKLSPGLPATAAIHHGGTFNANPLVATAGKIMLEHLTVQEIARLNRLGDLLAAGIRDVFTRRKIKAQITGYGSLRNLHFTEQPVVDYKTAQTSRKPLMHLVHLGLLARGIFLPARGLFALSMPMTEKEIEVAIKAMDDIIIELKPIVEQAWPELIG